MRTVFADAGYWIALLNPRDRLHGLVDVSGEAVTRSTLDGANGKRA